MLGGCRWWKKFGLAGWAILFGLEIHPNCRQDKNADQNQRAWNLTFRQIDFVMDGNGRPVDFIQREVVHLPVVHSQDVSRQRPGFFGGQRARTKNGMF